MFSLGFAAMEVLVGPGRLVSGARWMLPSRLWRPSWTNRRNRHCGSQRALLVPRVVVQDDYEICGGWLRPMG